MQVLQKSETLRHAVTTFFELAGRLLRRCAACELPGSAAQSLMFPAVSLTLQWLATHPELAETPASMLPAGKRGGGAGRGGGSESQGRVGGGGIAGASTGGAGGGGSSGGVVTSGGSSGGSSGSKAAEKGGDRELIARMFFWGQCGLLLNRLLLAARQAGRELLPCTVVTALQGGTTEEGREARERAMQVDDDEMEGEGGMLLHALWEDVETRGFVPFERIQAPLDFSPSPLTPSSAPLRQAGSVGQGGRGSEEEGEWSREETVRARRVIEAGLILSGWVKIELSSGMSHDSPLPSRGSARGGDTAVHHPSARVRGGSGRVQWVQGSAAVVRGGGRDAPGVGVPRVAVTSPLCFSAAQMKFLVDPTGAGNHSSGTTAGTTAGNATGHITGGSGGGRKAAEASVRVGASGGRQGVAGAGAAGAAGGGGSAARAGGVQERRQLNQQQQHLQHQQQQEQQHRHQQQQQKEQKQHQQQEPSLPGSGAAPPPRMPSQEPPTLSARIGAPATAAPTASNGGNRLTTVAGLQASKPGDSCIEGEDTEVDITGEGEGEGEEDEMGDEGGLDEDEGGEDEDVDEDVPAWAVDELVGIQGRAEDREREMVELSERTQEQALVGTSRQGGGKGWGKGGVVDVLPFAGETGAAGGREAGPTSVAGMPAVAPTTEEGGGKEGGVEEEEEDDEVIVFRPHGSPSLPLTATAATAVATAGAPPAAGPAQAAAAAAAVAGGAVAQPKGEQAPAAFTPQQQAAAGGQAHASAGAATAAAGVPGAGAGGSAVGPPPRPSPAGIDRELSGPLLSSDPAAMRGRGGAAAGAGEGAAAAPAGTGAFGFVGQNRGGRGTEQQVCGTVGHQSCRVAMPLLIASLQKAAECFAFAFVCRCMRRSLEFRLPSRRCAHVGHGSPSVVRLR